MAGKSKRESPGRLVADNRKARFNYHVEDTVEAGIALQGTEVKSLRRSGANIAESYAEEKDGQIWLINAHIPEYKQGNINNHEPRRPRKLLLHKREIGRLGGAVQQKGMTLVPLKIYFNDRGIAKLLLGLAKGKQVRDKRETEKKRDWQRQKERLLKEYG